MAVLSVEACVANIGTAQRRLRVRLGVVALVAAAAAAVGGAALGASTWLRAMFVLPLLFVGFQGLIQAREKT